MGEFQVFCPNCGTKNRLQTNEISKCKNEACRASLVIKEQYHAGGFEILVRYD